jgi:hypothetical protein
MELDLIGNFDLRHGSLGWIFQQLEALAHASNFSMEWLESQLDAIVDRLIIPPLVATFGFISL